MSANSEAISFLPVCSTSISWDDGGEDREIRIYHLGPGNILQEYVYSASKRRNGSAGYRDDLHDLKIVLDPASSLAAHRTSVGGIYVYYQDLKDFIRTLYREGPTKQWRIGSGVVATALKGSSIAVVEWFDVNGSYSPRIFYQNRNLQLKEALCNHSARCWVSGDFNPGVQPRGTPITAEVIRGGGVDIKVTWRDEQGRVMSSSWSKSSGWDLQGAGSGHMDGRG